MPESIYLCTLLNCRAAVGQSSPDSSNIAKNVVLGCYMVTNKAVRMLLEMDVFNNVKMEGLEVLHCLMRITRKWHYLGRMK